MKKIATFDDFLSLFPYGASELKREFQKYLTIALVISVGIHLALVGSYFLGKFTHKEEAPTGIVVHFTKYQDLGPPPSIAEQAAPPAMSVAVQAARPTVGVPVPVPETEANTEATIATQTQMSQMQPVSNIGTGSDSLVVTAVPEAEPSMDEFVAVEIEPVAIVQVKPNYPEMARRAEVEGTVYIKALVDKEGKVKKAVPVEGPEIFYDEAVRASMQWVFKPAIQHDQPVSVWVVIPFRFNVKD
ncbi:MAG TPA: energy transducer TonB [bacterium]|nr:energy transducer TonB [bacterium]